MKNATVLLILLTAFALGCAKSMDFNYGMGKLAEIDSKYGTNISSYPDSQEQIDLLLADLEPLRNISLQSGREQFNYVLNYRILNLEAERLFAEGAKNGLYNLATKGFACKPRPLIIESVALRNGSAQKGYEAVSMLREFVDKYPEEAEIAGLSNKNALFLNASFYEVERIARADSNLINRFCPMNVTLELYKEEFRKRTNLSEEYITNIGYDDAVKIWKKIREIE